MLKSFRVDNFKTLINFDFEPGGLNLLLGTNNAGKTNLCHALRFLSLTTRMPLDDAAAECTAEPWNLLNVYTQNRQLTLSTTSLLTLNNEQLTFTYELILDSQKGSRTQSRGRPFTLHKETLRVSGDRFNDTVLVENDEGRVRLLHEMNFLRGVTQPPEYVRIATTAPTDATMLFRLYDLETNQRSNLFKRYLASWGYYNLDPARLRTNQARPMDSVLDSTGANLSSVLFNLHNATPRTERSLIDSMKALEPRLDLLSFQAPDPEHVYMFFEDKKGNKFGVDNVSDGTLRYLAISYLILAGEEGVFDTGSRPVIMIEEPENGIYVGHFRGLFDRIDPSGKTGQFIFTSHSPYFIDLFDATPEGLFLIKSGDTHSSLVKPDSSKIRKLLDTFSLGDMYFRGLFE